MMFWYREGRRLEESEFQVIKENKKVILFGDSIRNQGLFEKIEKEDIVCIFDNDEEKWGCRVKDIPIVKPYEKNENVILVSAVYDWNSISKQVRQLGYEEIYFSLQESEEKFVHKYRSQFALINKEIILQESQKKYIHVIPDEKFFMSVVEYIEYGLNIKEHFFLVYGVDIINPNDEYYVWPKYKELIEKYHNVYLLYEGRYRLDSYTWEDNKESIEYLLENAEKIIFHGEWMTPLICEYFTERLNLVKSKGVFIPWGAGVGKNPVTKPNVDRVLQYVRMLVCPSVENVMYLKTHYQEIAKAIWYNNGFSYARLTEHILHKPGKIKNIFVSHCAHDYAKPFESLKYAAQLNMDCYVYCITSYGTQGEALEAYGEEVFGNRFISVNHYMPYKEYVKFLSHMDVAMIGMEIMAGRNTLELLFWTGVKVYLKPDTDVYKRMQSFGYKIHDFYSAEMETEEQFWNNPDREHNHLIAAKEYDADLKLSQWKEIYEYDLKG